MTRAEALSALGAGVDVAQRLVDEGADVLLTGDMGIANTTASAALVAAFTGASPDEVTGRGTGVDDATLGRKIDVVRRALDRSGLTPNNASADPVGALAAVGGLEHAALAGFVLAGSARRVPVILDGVIAGAAALVAHALAPASIDTCLAGHRSAEPGHAHALRCPRAAPARRPRPAARGGDRRRPRAPAGAGRGRGPARHGDVRRGRRRRQDRRAGHPRWQGPSGKRRLTRRTQRSWTAVATTRSSHAIPVEVNSTGPPAGRARRPVTTSAMATRSSRPESALPESEDDVPVFADRGRDVLHDDGRPAGQHAVDLPGARLVGADRDDDGCLAHRPAVEQWCTRRRRADDDVGVREGVVGVRA